MDIVERHIGSERMGYDPMAEVRALPSECHECWIYQRRLKRPLVHLDQCNSCYRKTKDVMNNDNFTRERP